MPDGSWVARERVFSVATTGSSSEGNARPSISTPSCPWLAMNHGRRPVLRSHRAAMGSLKPFLGIRSRVHESAASSYLRSLRAKQFGPE